MFLTSSPLVITTLVFVWEKLFIFRSLEQLYIFSEVLHSLLTSIIDEAVQEAIGLVKIFDCRIGKHY
jgi:hypothetical protein